METCSYNTTYHDYDLRKPIQYKCPDEVYAKGLCKFHLTEYAADEKNREEMSELLKKKVEDANVSEESLEWIGYWIPPEFAISSEFKANVYLNFANFLGNTSFRGCNFRRYAYFNNAQFNGTASFNGAQFSKARFESANFNGTAEFYSAQFNEGTSFGSTQFNGRASFGSTQFNEVSFDSANFNGTAEFTSTQFNGRAGFTSAKFGMAIFDNAQFNGTAEFYSAQFNEGTSFESTQFNIAIFDNAQFNGEATFSNAAFNGEAVFDDVRFNNQGIFNRARFNGDASFYLSSEPIKGVIVFTNVFLKEQQQLTFNGDLSKISFAKTDITRVHFGDNVVWGRKQKRSPGNGDESKDEEEEPANDIKSTVAKERIDFKINDERALEEDVVTKNKEPHNSLEAVIAEYRNLRENYEYNLRYEEAGQFFIREMELRRKYKQESPAPIQKKNILERIFSFAGLYYAVSKYGESTRRPLIITISVFTIATLYFWYIEKGPISDSATRAVTAFFPFFSLPEDYGFLDVVLRATMIPLAGVLFITLRRKLERRFRH